jgi:hypothetical protein
MIKITFKNAAFSGEKIIVPNDLYTGVGTKVHNVSGKNEYFRFLFKGEALSFPTPDDMQQNSQHIKCWRDTSTGIRYAASSTT